MIPVLLFPQFSPTIVEFGPIALGGYQFGPFGIRWYAMAYILGLVLGWRLMRRLVRLAPAVAEPLQVDDFLTWATLGVVLKHVTELPPQPRTCSRPAATCLATRASWTRRRWKGWCCSR